MSRYLLVFDRRQGRILHTSEFADGKAALAGRLEAEDDFRGDSDIEIVVLTATSPEELRRTHARYFEKFDEIAAKGVFVASASHDK